MNLLLKAVVTRDAASQEVPDEMEERDAVELEETNLSMESSNQEPRRSGRKRTSTANSKQVTTTADVGGTGKPDVQSAVELEHRLPAEFHRFTPPISLDWSCCSMFSRAHTKANNVRILRSGLIGVIYTIPV